MPSAHPDFDELARNYGSRIRDLVIKRTHDYHLAEDVAQETLLRAYRFWHLFDQAKPVWPWLSMIAIRLCSNTMARERKRGTSDRVIDLTAAASLLPPAGDPGERLSGLEGEVLWSMPENYRRVLLLKHALDLDYEDIAELEGRTHASIDTMLRRARRMFRERLESARNQIGLSALVLRLRMRARRITSEVGETLRSPFVALASVELVLGLAALVAAGSVPHSSLQTISDRSFPPYASQRAASASTSKALSSTAADQGFEPMLRVTIGPHGAIKASFARDSSDGRRSLRREIYRHLPVGDPGGDYHGDTDVYCDAGAVARTLCWMVDRVP